MSTESKPAVESYDEIRKQIERIKREEGRTEEKKAQEPILYDYTTSIEECLYVPYGEWLARTGIEIPLWDHVARDALERYHASLFKPLYPLYFYAETGLVTDEPPLLQTPDPRQGVFAFDNYECFLAATQKPCTLY